MRNAFKPARSYPLRQGIVAFKRRVSEPATSPSKRSNAPRKSSFFSRADYGDPWSFSALFARGIGAWVGIYVIFLFRRLLCHSLRGQNPNKPRKPTGRPKGVIFTRKTNSYAFASPVARVIRQLIPQNGMSAA